MGHNTLPSKAIQAISIDCPRDMWRINGFTSSRSPLLQFLTLRVITNKEKREKKYKSLSIDLDSERRHKASKVELLVVQPLKELFGIGNKTPHELYSASVMECRASINSRGSLGICGSSIFTNWHLTFSAKYIALKPAPSKGQVISEEQEW